MFVGIEEVRGYADELFSWTFRLLCTLKSGLGLHRGLGL